jgi:uncharacterized protein
MRELLAELRATIAPVAELRLQLQTNGVRLDAEYCSIFTEFAVSVGVSLDGDRVANDRHRVFADGRSSHSQVRAALTMLREHPHLYGGILCTIDVRNDPISVYESLVAERPPVLDLLLPHATWDNPPVRPNGAATPYADWLTRIHQRWLADGRPMPIRLFDSVASLARGGPSMTEALGPDPVSLLTIETDGTWEQVDSLKIAFQGAPETGLDVFSHPVSEAAAHPAVAMRREGQEGLAAECQTCPVVSICGGGLYSHRYRSGSGFRNPSVFCADLKEFITQVAPLPQRTRRIGTARERDPTPSGIVASLAAGAGDRSLWERIVHGHTTLTRAKVAKVASLLRYGPLHRVAVDGWELLCALDQAHPVASRTVFGYPYVRA